MRAGDIRHPSAAAAAAHGAPHLNSVPCVARCATHALVLLHGQFLIQTKLGSARSAGTGRAPPRLLCLPATRAAAVAPFTLSRSIENLRPRLDPAPLKPRPSDLDPMIQIGAYPFALAYLLKRPWGLSDSTRSPVQFKTNYRSAQNFAQTPLSFLEIKPAIQGRRFCVLALRING